MRDFDVAVVGGGVMGVAAARSLSETGRRVVLLEQFDIGHKHGSSHGSSRIFRFSYRDCAYVRMAQEALALWRSLEQITGQRLVTTMGGLDLGEGIEANAAALRACGADAKMLDAAEAARRFPGLRFPAGRPVLYQPDAGFVAAESAWRALAAEAQRLGAEMRPHARVTAVRQAAGGVEVVAGGVVVGAAVAVLTAGPWLPRLLAMLGIDVDVRATRETVAYFRTDGLAPLPVVEWGQPSAYALPAPGVGLKAGLHMGGPTADPDGPRSPDERSVATIAEWVAEHFPTADSRPLTAETCMYTNTPDQSFVLERRGRIVIGSACSGHGFKFAPLIGARLAALAQG